MKNSLALVLYVQSACVQTENLSELEDYVCDYSWDEENQKAYYLSTKPSSQEIFVDEDFVLEHTAEDFSLVKDCLLKADSQLQQENIIENLEHPLLRYYAKMFLKKLSESKKSPSVFPVSDNFLFGAGVLLQSNPQFHKQNEVVQTIQFLRKQGFSIPEKPKQQIAAYMELLGDPNYGSYAPFLDKKDVQDKSSELLLQAMVIKRCNFPESYFKNQAEIHRQQGRGEMSLDANMRNKMMDTVMQDQKRSLEQWLDYLQQQYPGWYNFYVLEALSKMGAYNPKNGRYSKRRKDYVGTFPELNREALAQVYSHLQAFHSKSLSEDLDTELLNILKTGSFVRLYEYFLQNHTQKDYDKTETSGQWIKYEQSENKEQAELLASTLQGWNTGWCTAGEQTAREQLAQGDFYVYYSKNKMGMSNVPRVAIRMEDDEVAEVRGIEKDQNMEALMTTIMQDKIQNLKGGKEYFIKSRHMQMLSEIEAKIHEDVNVQLSKEDLCFFI